VNDSLTVIRHQDGIEAERFAHDEPADFLEGRISDWVVIFPVQPNNLLVAWTGNDSSFLNAMNFSIGEDPARGCANALEIID
jgi:hypothetical protein